MAVLTTFYIKQNDRLPSISATLQTVAGVAVDLTGGTVKFLMRTRAGAAAKIDAAAVIVNAVLGTVRYDWGATDTDTASTFQGEFEWTQAGGKLETFPNAGYLEIVIGDDVA